MYKILLVDDNLIFAMGSSLLIKETIKNADIYTATSLAEVEAMIKEDQYKMLIICLSINSQIMLNKIYDLGERLTNLSILICCENTTDLPFQQLYKAGIRGILDKRASINAFNSAIIQVRDGKCYIDNRLCMAMISINNTGTEMNTFSKLSNRENLVAKLLLEGKSNLQIGELMQLQPSTISTFKTKIYKNYRSIICWNFFFTLIR